MRLIRHITLHFMAVIFIFSCYTYAQNSPFRSEFTANHIGSRFNQQVELVKKNKDIIPGEVKSVIADALSPDKSYELKMYLLNIARAMASMHSYWNNDEKPLIEAETVIRMEIQKEKERIAEIDKWKHYEKFLGNLVMKEHKVQMEDAGLNPVIFPHWLHRIWFQCKVCHQDIFLMKRGGNDISHANFNEGRQCVVCHDGKMAFGADEKCKICHNVDSPGIDSLYDMKKINNKRINDVATRIGAEWNMENLEGGAIPLDRFGYINWLELKARNIFKPINSLTKNFKEEVRNNQILFESTSPTVKNVLFDHGVHSTWIKCDTCHPSIFTEKLGDNHIKMTDMAAGRFCGYCHGKVSFTFADCIRCHNLPKDKQVKDALIHKAQ